MPICPKCGGNMQCGTQGCLPGAVGSVVKPCSEMDGGLWVHVLDEQGLNQPGVKALKDGGAEQATDPSGLARWDPLPAGPYVAGLNLAPELLRDFEPPGKTEENVRVSKGQITYVGFELRRKAALKVQVVKRTDVSSGLADADVEVVDGPDKPPAAKTAGTIGLHDFTGSFGKVRSGKYQIKATLKPEDAAKFATIKDFAVETQSVTLAAGQIDTTTTVEVEARNLVAPKIEVEYKVVLLDRKLSTHQPTVEAPVKASATKIELTLTEADASQPDKPYGGTHHHTSGGTFSCAGGKVEVFLDAECKKPLPSDGKIAGDKLRVGKRVPLWLRGAAVGDFTAKLVLEDSPDRFVSLPKKDIESPMHVVELKFTVHQHDKAKLNLSAYEVDPDVEPVSNYHTALKDMVLPPQQALSDEDKVKKGRLLHLADGEHHSRARVLLAKLDAWPGAADEYTVVLRQEKLYPAKGGALKLFDKEFGGTEKALPLKIKVADLKAADLELWVEGTETAKALRNAVLQAGLDRAVGLDPVAHTPKHSGDWACFSVVKVAPDKIKVDYPAPGTGPVAWDEPGKRFFINLQADPDGRKITVGASLSEALQGVTLHFMLAPDKDNQKAANAGKDLPATWIWKDITSDVKHKDKAARKTLLHLSAETDDKGYAKVELQLSRFGGDVFHIGVYVDQDPHLSKFIDGHAQLEAKKPALKSKAVTVWRKFWYQLVEVTGIANPGVAGAVAKFEAIKCVVSAATASRVDPAPPNSIYPRYMLKALGGTTDILVVSTTNMAGFFGGFTAEADKPIKVPILVCDDVAVGNGATSPVDTGWLPFAASVSVTTDKTIVTPPLQGGDLVVAGDVSVTWEDATAPGTWVTGPTVNLTSADLQVVSTRASVKTVQVTIPAAIQSAAAGKPNAHVAITGMSLQGAMSGILGFSTTSGSQKITVAAYDSSKIDLFNYTVAHELGHRFGQVPKEPAGEPTGAPVHPHQYISYKDGRPTGSHCNHATNLCLMYQSAPIPGSLNRFCDACYPYVLTADLSKP